MKTINVVQVNNPLDPSDATRGSRPFSPGQTLADLFPQVVRTEPMVYSVNGKIIDDLASYRLKDGDWVVEMPSLRGGNAKSILRIVALIAVAVIAWEVAPYLVGEFGVLGGTGLTAAQVAVGLTVAGSYLVNSMLPPPRPTTNTNGDSMSSSPSYGIDGAKNTSAEGIAVPVVYGQFRMGGNIIDNFVVNDSDSQWLYMLINAGEGQIAGIPTQSVLINNQPITTYKDYAVTVRDGSPFQAQLSDFPATVTPRNVNLQLTTDFKSFTTPGVCDRLRLDFVFPTGLFQINDDGNTISNSREIEVQYRKVGDTTWTPFNFTNSDASYTNVTQWLNPYSQSASGQQVNQGSYDITGHEVPDENGFWHNVAGALVGTQITQLADENALNGIYDILAAQRTTYRRSFVSQVLDQGQYEVQYRVTQPDSTDPKKVDQVWLSDVNEIILDDVRYNNTALLALRIRLSDQLSSFPTVTYINGGKVIRCWDETSQAWVMQASSNPAWIVLDILTNARYGGGCPLSRIDMGKFRDWATFCDAQGLTFNGIFDTQGNIWDAANEVARCGHAQLVAVGTKFSVTIERQDTPVMLFSVANMVQGSFKETWLSLEERANEVEVTFYDKTDNYTQKTVRVYDADAISNGTQQRTASITPRGIVDSQRAFNEGQLLLNLNKYVLRTVEFSAPLEAIACTVGDVILVQHDMPAWGYAGRVEDGCTTTSLNLDRTVEFEPGKSYQVLVHFDTGTVATGTIASISGNRLELNGYNNQSCKRLLIGSTDMAVVSTFFNSTTGRYGVEVDDASGLSVGQNYTLADTNVLVTRDLVNPASGDSFVDTQVLTLASPLPSAPALYAKWSFGEVQKTAKPFRVKSISGGNDLQRDITAIEYNDATYDLTGTVPVINYSALSFSTVQNVTIDGVWEDLVLVGTDYQSNISIAYHSDQSSYETAEVFVARNGGTFVSLGENPRSVTTVAYQGDLLEFRVVAKDRLGNSGTISSSSRYIYNVVGKNTAPSSSNNFAAVLMPGGVLLQWILPIDRSIKSSELRYGTDFDSGTPIWSGAGDSYLWPRPADGTYTVWLVNFDTAGNPSTPVSTTVTVDPSIEISSYSATLSNDSYVLAADVFGNVSDYSGAVSKLTLYKGTVDDTVNWSISKTDFNCTSTLSGSTVTVTEMIQDQAYVDIKATRLGYPDQIKRFSLSKARAGATGGSGSAGADATAYWLATSAAAIKQSGAGAYTPADITVTAYSATGSASPVTYGARFVIATSPDGQNYTNVYTSAANETTKDFNIPAGVATVRVSMYQAGGTTNLLDQQIVPVVSDGQNAVTMFLTNDSQVLPSDSSGNITSFQGATTTPKVYVGATDDTANWTITKADTNVTSTFDSGVDTITAMSVAQDTGYVDFTATKTGFPSFTARFTVTKSKAGSAGSDGAPAPVFTLSAPAMVVPADSSGAVTSYDHMVSTCTVVLGTTDDTANWTFTKVDGPNVVTTISGGTITLTEFAQSVDAGYTDVTAAKAGYPHLTQRINFTKTKAGAPGSAGADGARGNVQLAYATSGTSWSDSDANAALTAAGYSGPKFGDIVMLHNGNYSESRMWDDVAWSPLAALLNGSVLIDGSVKASKIDARGLTIEDDAGNVILEAGSTLNWSALGGAPGNLSGLGYTGDLNATKGATFGVDVNGQITPANASTYIAAAAIESEMVADLRTVNYAEDGSANPTAGAKISSTGTAIKVANAGIQIGTVTFTDYWFRLVQGIDGVSGGALIWRGNNDASTRGGAPDISRLAVFTWESQVVNSNFQQVYHQFSLTPSSYTGFSDNLDAMTQIHVQFFQATTSTAPFTEFYLPSPSRVYDGATGVVSGSWHWGWRFQLTDGTPIGPGAQLENNNQYSGYLRLRIANTYGWSATTDLGPTTVRGGQLPAATITGVAGLPPSAGGSTGGACPAPWVKIKLVNGVEVMASQLHNGAKVAAVNDTTLEPVPGGGTIRDLQVIWKQRYRVKLTDGTTTEWSENHRLAVVNKGWVEVQKIRPGDQIVAQKEAIVESVLAVDKGQVISFRVDGAGTYFGDGLLCHNTKTIP
jgi:predicted phage tail protein